MAAKTKRKRTAAKHSNHPTRSDRNTEQGAATYPLTITCPQTGKEVETGLAMSRAAFKDPAVVHSAVNECPACGQRHEYDIEDARLRRDS